VSPEPVPAPAPAPEPEPEPEPAPAPKPDKPARVRKPSPPPEKAPVVEKKKEPPGKLSIDARPWATIYIDGKKIGPTPIVNRDVPAGDHTIRAVAEDGTEKTMRVRVEPGGTVRRKVTW
jgi:serine/threonine-protein kinase